MRFIEFLSYKVLVQNGQSESISSLLKTYIHPVLLGSLSLALEYLQHFLGWEGEEGSQNGISMLHSIHLDSYRQ